MGGLREATAQQPQLSALFVPTTLTNNFLTMARRKAAPPSPEPIASSSRASSVASSSSRGSSGSDDEADLEQLFQASIAAYTAGPSSSSGADVQHFDDDDDVILLDGNDTEKRTKAISAEALAPQAKAASTAAAAAAVGVVDKGKGKGKAPADRHLEQLDSKGSLQQLRPVGQRALMKRRQEVSVRRSVRSSTSPLELTSFASSALPQERAKTAGSSWYDMPAFPTDDTKSGPSSATSRYSSSARGPTAEEMRREVQAIRLRNALDPKRFYKGGNKDKGMPKFAQVSARVR